MRRKYLDRDNGCLSIRRQCILLGISRSGYYYQPREMSSEERMIVEELDKIYTKWPYYGTRRMSKELLRRGFRAGRKRVRRLMGILGVRAIYPKKRLSIPNKEHKVYPYLIKGVNINRPGMVWGADITYIKLSHGFVYLVVIIDWFSRYVLSWRISTTLDSDFCIEALKEALSRGKPEYFNTDQGSQFTCNAFTDILKAHEIKISMDGKGRVYDNIFVERFWRTLKYEEVYLKSYESAKECKSNIRDYLRFYNNERIHQSLDYHTPSEVHYGIDNNMVS